MTEREDTGRTASFLARAMFALAVICASLATTYTAVASLARVTPALFPGQQLSDIVPNAVTNIPVVSELPKQVIPKQVIITEPDASSIFNRPIQFLVVGIDRREGQDYAAAYNTDTIMVASVHPVTKEIRVLSIPRDLYVTIHAPSGEEYQDRINASFGVGVGSTNDWEAGLEQLAKDVELNFEIEIDHYVAVDIVSAERLFDAMGGIDVSIPYEIAVPDGLWYSNDDKTPEYLYFPAGPQHLDGYHAVAFSRVREPDDDLHRIRRQQVVMQAFVSKAFAGGFLKDPLAMWDAYGDAVHNNVPTGKMAGYGLLLKQTRGNMSVFSLADPVAGIPTISDFRSPYGAAVLRWNEENARYWFDRIINPLGAEPTPEPTVEAEGGAGSRAGP
ncbi:MAG: LCP family protein [Dehalococcoidia bacterium]|nr:LCP family protein [Dehalococcoidia bacterium]